MVSVNLKINRLLGHRAPTTEATHRVIHKSQKKGRLLAAFLVLGGLHCAS
jgi:uncharacterized membrane protein